MWALFFSAPDVDVRTISLVELNSESGLSVCGLHSGRLSRCSSELAYRRSFGDESPLVQPRQCPIHSLVVIVATIIVYEHRRGAGEHIVRVDVVDREVVHPLQVAGSKL